MNERISREEIVKLYKIEVQFFNDLVDCGLLRTHQENEVHYLLYDELPVLERFANWHYDLEVNIPGLEIIHELLQKLEQAQREKLSLLQKLNAVSGGFEDADL